MYWWTVSLLERDILFSFVLNLLLIVLIRQRLFITLYIPLLLGGGVLVKVVKSALGSDFSQKQGATSLYFAPSKSEILWINNYFPIVIF